MISKDKSSFLPPLTTTQNERLVTVDEPDFL